MKMDKLLVYLTALTILTVLLGNLFRSWVFFMGAISSLALFVIVGRSLPPDDIRVDVRRETSRGIRDVYLGDEIELNIHLENKGDELRFLEVHDILPSLVEVVDGSNHQIVRLEKGEKKDLYYKISCPVSGKIEVGPTKIRYRDTFNFFSEELDEEENISIRILPRVQEMKKIDINPSYTKHWLGDIKSKSIGVGNEFFSLREYHIGDEIRDINWKATARYQKPFTNEYEAEKSGDVILVVDGYKKGIVGTMRNNTLESSVDAAASLSSAILSARNQVGVIVAGEYLNWVYPGTGKNQYQSILSNLAKFEKGGTWGLEGVKWLLEDFFPRRSMIIFISPLTVPEFSDTIVDFCRREYDVMVISPDPVKIEKNIVGDLGSTAEKLHRAERKNIIEKLWTYGTVVVDWDPNQPLEPALEEVLRYRQRKRRA